MKKINKLMRALLLTLVATLAIGFQSCNSYLDVDEYIDQMTSLDSVFSRKALLVKYVNGAAHFSPNEGNIWTNSPTPFQMASDENFASWNDDRHAGMKFLLDEITPYSWYYNNYPGYYQGIRMALTSLKRMHEVPDITDIERRELMGRCYFLVGYYYYRLMLQYGPVPIVPEEPFSVDSSIEEMSLERGTYDECVAEIKKYMLLAAQYLPLETESAAVVTIPTRWAAIATLSRITLYAASPWYNGNPFYSDWMRKSDGAHFIPQTKDNTKWGVAAAYAKYIIDSNNYSLYTTPKEMDSRALPTGVTSDPDYYKSYPNGAAGIDHYRSLTYPFNGELPVMINKEFIYSCAPNTTGDASPIWISAPYQLGGGNGLNLVQDMVDAFGMIDGQKINDSSSDYPYPDSENNYLEVGGADQSFSGFTLKSKTARMYNNREPRFYATVGYCHSFWPGTSSTDNNFRNKEVTYYSDGYAAASSENPEDYNRTGYTCIKYNHLEDNLKASSLVRAKYFPIFRYAETLLNYVEAINELDAPFTMEIVNGDMVTVERKPSEIVKYFNSIRYRAGLPGITEAEASDKEYVRELIKHERRVEFACEGHRYHDLRRWGNDAMVAYNLPITGMNVKMKSTQRKEFYSVTVLNDKLTRRSFSYKHYFYPIPKSVLDKNKNLVQNPEWN